MQLLLMADSVVGGDITRWLLREYPQDLGLVVTTADNELFTCVRAAGVDCIVFESTAQVCAHAQASHWTPDLGLLAWWPRLVRRPLLELPTHGFINTHPSLLPYNRGKHYNFWALVEQAPFGATLHFADDGVDSGDIVAQMAIPYDWEDNGATLYAKASDAMVRLFQANYPAIRTLSIPRRHQEHERASFHRADELERASVIDLDREYRARDLLNLIRARTFPGHPACSFIADGAMYEVRVSITRKTT